MRDKYVLIVHWEYVHLHMKDALKCADNALINISGQHFSAV